jgi:3-methyladenine DNA glycosylase AlkD
VTLKQTLAALRKAGTAQNRKVYARHGVTGDRFGVSFAELGKLEKKIGVDHELAVGLWATGNHDARVLATMVADPAAMTSRQLDAWARDLDSYVIADAFASLVMRGPHARRKFEAWKNRRSEFTAACGWNLLAGLALDQENDLEAKWLREQLAVIRSEIHDRPNRVRHSMNQALIAIGVRDGALEKAAVAAAKKIGKVEVDHGETSCKTPDAAAYIAKTLAHRAKGGAKRKQAGC